MQDETLQVPPIVFRTWTLDNGLKVLAVPDSQVSSVAIQVWYRVGSKDDPAGRSGFAHLFEHLMFKRTLHMRDEMLDRLTEDVGGENNAFTTADATVYHETVPANHLERLLWAEADRMANLQVDASNFASERDVVKEEYRQSVLADPYGLLDDAIERRSWAVHPYQRPTIGNIKELNAATLEDVREFYKTFYRPDNATLIVAGAYDKDSLESWVEKYFAPIPRPEPDIPRVTVREPTRTRERRYSETSPNVPLPAVAMSYLTPPAAHPDADALKVLDAILSGGESARFHQSLVYTQQLASDASTGADLRADAGLLTVRATAAGGKSLDALERATLAELDKIRQLPPTAAELARAKARLLTALLQSRETPEGKAFALGEASVNEGDVRRANTALQRLMAVTAADVQRVAVKYLNGNNRVSVRYTTGPSSIDASAVRPTVTPEKTPADITPTRPPAPAPTRPVVVPTPVVRAFNNGLRIITIPRPGTGLFTARMMVLSGGASDPVRKDGEASLTASLLTRGTRTRSATELAQDIEALGTQIDTGAGRETSFAALNVAMLHADDALELLADVLMNPAFANAEVVRRRTEAVDERTVGLESPNALARLAILRRLYGDSPYGRPTDGLPDTLKRIRRDDVVRYHRTHYRPDNAALVLCGDFTHTQAQELAEKHFSKWKRPAAAPPKRPRFPLRPTERHVIVIDDPKMGQSAVTLARPALARPDPLWAAGQVANSLYGGGYSSRLNIEVRIKRGLSYGAGSSISGGIGVGPLLAACQTKHESAGEVAQLFLDELARLATEKPDELELAARKSALIGPYLRGLETTNGIADTFAALLGPRLKLSEVQLFAERARNIGPTDVPRFAAQKLAATYATVVIVGDAKKFLPDLKRRLGRVEVIPRAKLNLESPTLR
ncbi:MAG: pitrilysin family protein [Armatimonas sp.]